jgi:hypothetical protein
VGMHSMGMYGVCMHIVEMSAIGVLKGTVLRDFLPLVFFVN